MIGSYMKFDTELKKVKKHAKHLFIVSDENLKIKHKFGFVSFLLTLNKFHIVFIFNVCLENTFTLDKKKWFNFICYYLQSFEDFYFLTSPFYIKWLNYLVFNIYSQLGNHRITSLWCKSNYYYFLFPLK